GRGHLGTRPGQRGGARHPRAEHDLPPDRAGHPEAARAPVRGRHLRRQRRAGGAAAAGTVPPQGLRPERRRAASQEAARPHWKPVAPRPAQNGLASTSQTITSSTSTGSSLNTRSPREEPTGLPAAAFFSQRPVTMKYASSSATRPSLAWIQPAPRPMP